MKASRAYIAGLGTTGVLLSFALLLLVVFGAILASRGWPDAASAEDGVPVRLGEGEGLTRIKPVRFATASAAPAAAGRTSSTLGNRTTGAAGRGAVKGISSAGTRPQAATEAAPEPAPGAGPAQPAAPGAPAAPAVPEVHPPSPPSVGDVANGLGAGQVVEGVQGAVGGVDATVGASGDAVSELVQGTTDTAEQSLPRLP